MNLLRWLLPVFIGFALGFALMWWRARPKKKAPYTPPPLDDPDWPRPARCSSTKLVNGGKNRVQCDRDDKHTGQHFNATAEAWGINWTSDQADK